MNNNDDIDLGSDLHITKVEKRTSAPGAWVTGTLHGHKFQALVFPEHAECSEYEIGDSKISKLWIRCESQKKTVYNWDRGADIPPANTLVTKIVGFLCAGLADHIFSE